ncbi:hypothetical protein NL676_014807 [Syzygium grande]|nr:hypothetical protein NL676_014807 [Syzygium grande]
MAITIEELESFHKCDLRISSSTIEASPPSLLAALVPIHWWSSVHLLSTPHYPISSASSQVAPEFHTRRPPPCHHPSLVIATFSNYCNLYLPNCFATPLAT